VSTGLAWINDIAIDRYDRAKSALDVVAAAEESVAQKKVPHGPSNG
jgi:hypothetical protein